MAKPVDDKPTFQDLADLYISRSPQIEFNVVVPWENPRWIRAFFVVLIADGATVYGIVRFFNVSPLIALALVTILTEIGIFVWFIQSPFSNRKALRNVLLVSLGKGLGVACSLILFAKSESALAGLAILITLLSRIWSRPLFAKLRAENEREQSHVDL